MPLTIVAIGVLVFVPMLLETALSRQNERRLRAGGAVEPADDVYAWMRVVYPGSFLAMLGEMTIRGGYSRHFIVAGIMVFAAAKLLKYWTIATLGARWSFRVLVPPDSTLIQSGPYRVMRHPNYVGVLGELAGAGVMTQAAVTGPLALLGFTALIVARIRAEERALGLRRK